MQVAPSPQDPDYARRLRRARDSALSGRVPAGDVRAPIRASWRRLVSAGLDPGHLAADPRLSREELERARVESGLAPVMDQLRTHLLPAVDDAGQVMVVTDARGRVLWREGPRGAVNRADALGFVPGSSWGEDTVGTNAIGTGLMVGRPLQVHAEEHFAEGHTRWTCAASPLRDPVDGRMLGIVDVSGPVASAHPHTLPMVTLASRTAQLDLAVLREFALAPLRAQAAGVLARMSAPALVVACDGAVAAANAMSAPRAVRLPATLAPGVVHIPGLGWTDASPLAGGWLLRPERSASERPAEVTVELHVDQATLVVTSEGGSWSHRLTPRHVDLLVALAERPGGWSAAELAERIFGDRGKTVSIRAEMSRLRRSVGPLLGTRPYRWAEQVCLTVSG